MLARRLGWISVATIVSTVGVAAAQTRPAEGEGRALARVLGFRTPSGNVRCAAHPSAMRCYIHQTAKAVPRPRRCVGDWGKGFSLFPRGGAAWGCYSDALAPDDGFSVLAYGRSWAHYGLECLSTRGGLACTNARGRGFFMSRERQLFF